MYQTVQALALAACSGNAASRHIAQPYSQEPNSREFALSLALVVTYAHASHLSGPSSGQPTINMSSTELLWIRDLLLTPLRHTYAAAHLWLCRATARRRALLWHSRLRLAVRVDGGEVPDVGQRIRHLPAGYRLRLGQRAGPVFSRRGGRSRLSMRSVPWGPSLRVVLGLPGPSRQQLLSLLHGRMCSRVVALRTANASGPGSDM